jgi:acetamidase/formamidase
MAIHTIAPDESTLHGFFSPEHPPVLTIDPGDTVRFRTLDAGWGLENFRPDQARPQGEEPARPKATTRHGPPYGHALCGPVFVRGAAPGSHLAVRIESLRPGPWGWTWAGGELAGNEELLHLWTIDADAGVAVNQEGHRLALRPFMGVMGNAPAEPGRHVTPPPRSVGGNIDCKELVAGATLYLPVAVPGALFSTGDGHARQGDGEASGTAIECPMDECALTFTLRDDLPPGAPYAETALGWLAFGFDEDLNKAAQAALDAMLNLMQQRLGLPRNSALALASVAVDLRVTQIVNGVKGIHAVLPHDAIEPAMLKL